ncbi:4Fe-4S binding protein [Occallatibacter riparius]|uniref:4Fe-4S binding protein n=1 Tax=Occallatibacter riparius TaxID=1002689 RepID=A0A9J7BLT8_9BACT|nr:4Fe-4S binding protein [Occallatibacter riparius]UWZ83607.1 4Fe-4S binding protein [Occallatibacter riparius]
MMPHRNSWRVWLRRLTQGGFLLLFLILFLQARYMPVNQTGRHVKLFFLFDPLVLAASWLSSHQVASGLLLSLVTIGGTILFGRWFCGWVCPFGALHHLLTGLRKQKAKQKMLTDGYSPWQKTKYYVLATLLVASLFGLNLTGWLDPFSLLYRSTAIVLYPTGSDGVKSLFGWIYQVDPGIAKLRLTAVSEPVYSFLSRTILPSTDIYFCGIVLIAILFAAVILLNLYRARFWCRYICPLGAMLGTAGKNPLIQIKRNEDLCNNCRLCVVDCQGGADPDVPDGWKPSECFYCYNCESACPHQAISFGLHVPASKSASTPAPLRWLLHFVRAPRQQKLDLGRRSLVIAGSAGLGTVLLARASAQGKGHTWNPALIRPPGSVAEDEFLGKCIRCGECMKVCPTNALQPALTEGGFAGLWTPVLNMKLGYCEYECNLCSQVCPTQAIGTNALEQKQQIRIGTAFFDRNRCLPWALARTCIVCEEHCPTPKKAIWLQEVQVTTPEGASLTVKQPHVNPDLCIGCGVCQNKCPLTDQRGVYVTSVGETRNPGNQALLGGSEG